MDGRERALSFLFHCRLTLTVSSTYSSGERRRVNCLLLILCSLSLCRQPISRFLLLLLPAWEEGQRKVEAAAAFSLVTVDDAAPTLGERDLEKPPPGGRDRK